MQKKSKIFVKDLFGLLLICGYFYSNTPYSHGQMCTDEKEVVGIMPLGMPVAGTRPLATITVLHGYDELPVTLKKRRRVC